MSLQKPLLFAVSVLFALTASIRAEYYSFYAENDIKMDGSDILYHETRYPYWFERTYNARWFPEIGSDDGRGIPYYSGPVIRGNGEKDFGLRETSYIQSFWSIYNPIKKGDAATADRWAPGFRSALSVAEGASGKVDGTMPMATKVWYPTLTRVWRPTGNPPNVSKCGQWCRVGIEGKWIHLSTFNIPFVGNRFVRDVRQFIEGIGSPHAFRRIEFRNYYFRKEGKWIPARFFYAVTRTGQHGSAGPMDDGAAAFFELTGDPAYKDKGNMHDNQTVTVKMKTPETPPFDALVVDNVAALFTPTQVFVKWNIPETSAPQFAYKAEVFDNETAAGEPVKTVEMIDPDARAVGIDVTGLSKPSVRLTITDIFDKKSAPITPTGAPAKLAAAIQDTISAHGLNYEYYEGEWDKLPSFDTLTPLQSGAISGLDVRVRRRTASYAMRFRGRVTIPADGVWNFGVRASDGTRLLIDGNIIVDSDGVHSKGYEVFGSVGLKAGKHSIEVLNFKGTTAESGIDLSWAGPGVPKGVVPETAWSRTPRQSEPSIVLKTPAEGLIDSQVSASVVPAGRKLQFVRFYDDNSCRGVVAQSTSSGGQRLFSGAFPFGVGAQKIKARLFYGENAEYTIDSTANDVVFNQREIRPWTFASIGKHLFHTSSTVSSDGVHTFIGDSLNINWQLITGDTTLVARLRRRPSSASLPQFDNSADREPWWHGGIIFRGDLESSPGAEMGQKFVALFSCVGGSIYLQDCTNWNAGGFYSEQVDNKKKGGEAYNWLKLKREKEVFTAYLSVDGVKWDLVGTRDMSAQKFAPAMHVGVYACSNLGGNSNPNYWQFDSVSVGDTQPPPKPLPDLAAHWPMDEPGGPSVRDATRGESHGLLVGDPARVEGVSKRGVELDGSTQHINLSAPGLYSNTVTYAGWIKRKGPQPGGAGILIDRSVIATGMMFGADNELRFQWQTESEKDSWAFASGLKVPDGLWTFVALTIEPTKATLYMRPRGAGLQKAGRPGKYDPAPVAVNLLVGNDTWDWRWRFKGAVDEFRIYRRALSEEELKKLSEVR